MNQLLCLRTLAVGRGVLGHHYVVGLAKELFFTLGQIQNNIEVDRELCFLQYPQATLDYVRLSVNEKDPKESLSVEGRAL